MAVSRYGPVELLPLWLFLFSSGLFAITVIHLTLRRKLGVSDFIEIPAKILKVSVVAVFISLILPFLILFGVFQYPQYLGRYEQYYGFKYIILTGVVGFAVGLIMSLDSLRLFISGDNNP